MSAAVTSRKRGKYFSEWISKTVGNFSAYVEGAPITHCRLYQCVIYYATTLNNQLCSTLNLDKRSDVHRNWRSLTSQIKLRADVWSRFFFSKMVLTRHSVRNRWKTNGRLKASVLSFMITRCLYGLNRGCSITL